MFLIIIADCLWSEDEHCLVIEIYYRQESRHLLNSDPWELLLRPLTLNIDDIILLSKKYNMLVKNLYIS